MSVNAALAKPGCGCGGSGGGNSGCGCCSGVASANLAATAFIRPRFFAVRRQHGHGPAWLRA
jgi:hypothetical protein